MYVIELLKQVLNNSYACRLALNAQLSFSAALFEMAISPRHVHFLSADFRDFFPAADRKKDSQHGAPSSSRLCSNNGDK